MRVDWYGQAAFRLSGQDATVFIDPFGDVSPLAERGIQFDYPAIESVDADLLLVTHEQLDHNGVETIGEIDLLFLPVGGGPTIGAEQAAAITHRLAPKWVVPMHYRTPRIGFLETADEFLEKMPHVERLSETGFDTDAFAGEDGPRAVVPAVP